MWETLIHDPTKLGACSWELPEIRLLKEQLANLKCDCEACGHLNRPTLYKRVHDSTDTEVQVNTAQCDGSTETDETHAASDSTWEMLLNDRRRLDPITNFFLSNKRANHCPGCMFALSIFRDNNFSVSKDQQSEALNLIKCTDNFTTYDVYFVEKSTSVPFFASKNSLMNGIFDCLDALDSNPKTKYTQISCTENTTSIPKRLMFDQSFNCDQTVACVMKDENVSCDNSSCSAMQKFCCEHNPAPLMKDENVSCGNSSSCMMLNLSYDQCPAQSMKDENMSCTALSCKRMQKQCGTSNPACLMDIMSCNNSSCNAAQNLRFSCDQTSDRLMMDEKSSYLAKQNISSGPTPVSMIDNVEFSCDKSTCSAMRELSGGDSIPECSECSEKNREDDNENCTNATCTAKSRLSWKFISSLLMKDEKSSCNTVDCSAKQEDQSTNCPYVLGTLGDGYSDSGDGLIDCCPKDANQGYYCPLNEILRNSSKKKETKSVSVLCSGPISCLFSDFSLRRLPPENQNCNMYMCYTQDGTQYAEDGCLKISEDNDNVISCNPCTTCNKMPNPKKNEEDTIADDFMNFIRLPLCYPSKK